MCVIRIDAIVQVVIGAMAIFLKLDESGGDLAKVIGSRLTDQSKKRVLQTWLRKPPADSLHLGVIEPPPDSIPDLRRDVRSDQ